MDHKVFKLGMTSDNVVFIVNHTRRDYVHSTKIIGIEDNGLLVQYYLQDATLTFARRDGEYRIIKVESPITKEQYDEIEEADVQPYLDAHFGSVRYDEVAHHGKADSKKTGREI
jgi:hypothetical protein